MRIPFSPPDMSEEEILEVADTLRSGWITTGPKTKEFERQIADFCKTRRAAAFSSATSAMEMTLHVMGIGPGDEVITTAYTYTATASAIYHVGAKIVLVDTVKGTYDMDPDLVRKAINEHTKAIVAVDLGGCVYPYYARLFEIAEEKKNIFHPANSRQKALGRIMIMADGAHSFGASSHGKMTGQIADFTCFSFHAVKNFTTAEGGAATWADRIETCGIDGEELYREYMLLSLHGQSKDALSKNTGNGWEYDVVAPLYKCNMTDILAAIGLAQMRRYPGLLARRAEIAKMYDEAFANLPVRLYHPEDSESHTNHHLYLVQLPALTREQCNEVITRMAENGIAANVHYKPLPLLTAYKNLGFKIEDFPNAYEMFIHEITLPLYSKLTDEEAQLVIEVFKNAVKSVE